MNIEVSPQEQAVLKKALESYLSETRLEIRETKGDKSTLHGEEDVVKGLLEKLS